MLYETRKNIWLILLALVFAALAATLATRWMKNRTAEIDAAQQKLSSLVIAARDVPLGSRLETGDLKVVRASAEAIPSDAYADPAEVVGQVTRSPLFAGEALIERRLSKYFGGSALAAVVDPLMRAVTVRVDDVLGVGGFILPENRVDVIATYNDPDRPRAETILRDIRVLAVDQRSSPQTDGPVLSRAVTLEVTPEGAERIATARQRGSIQLTLRNPLTKGLEEQVAAEAPVIPPAAVVTASDPVRSPQRKIRKTDSSLKETVTLIRGTVVAQRTAE